MNNIRNSMIGTSCIQETTTPEKAKHLVLTLRAERKVVEVKIEQVASKCDAISQKLAQSNLNQSNLKQSSLKISNILEHSTSGFYDMDDSSEEEVEDLKFDLEKNLSNVDNLEEQKELIEEEEALVEMKAEELVEVTPLQNFTTHMRNIMNQQGTSFFSMLTTAAVGTSAAIGGGMLGPVVATGAFVVTVNEMFKFVGQYINDVGAGDHLKAIGQATENIEKKLDMASASIKKAEQHLISIKESFELLETQKKQLSTLLNSTSKEMSLLAKEALFKLEEYKGTLSKQSELIEEAIRMSADSILIVAEQRSRLENLFNEKHEIDGKKTTTSDFENILKEIQTEITAILALSNASFDYQMAATAKMAEALEENTQLSSGHGEICDHLAKINALIIQLESADALIAEQGETIEKGKIANEKLSDENVKMNQLTKEMKTEVDISKNQLNAEKQVVKPGDQSIMYGNLGVATAGLTTGFMLGGPVVAVGGMMIGIVGIGSFAVHGVHKLRQMYKAAAFVDQKNKIEKMKDLTKATSVKVEAEYDYSHGSYAGAKTVKGLWNIGGSLINQAYGQETVSEWKSTTAGTVKCTFGNLTIPIAFDKSNPNLAAFGAISLPTQQTLSETLIEALDAGKISGKLILQLLKDLEQVTIGSEKIVMIKGGSDAMKSLKERCK